MEVTSRGNIMYVMLNICTTPLQLAFSIVTFVNNHLLNLYASIGLLFLHLLKYVVKHLVVGCAFIFVTLWTSVLMYSTFYLMYVPSSSVVRPVHFTFRSCSNGIGMCSFPVANVSLAADNDQVFGVGQKYRAFLKIVMPDSISNRDIGMFMVIIHLYDYSGNYRHDSSRSVPIRYRSDLLRWIQTAMLAPLYIAGFYEETQILNIEFFDEFWDDYTGALCIPLLCRYYLYYYPVLCALCGVTVNVVWLTVIFATLWYQLGLQILSGTGTDAATEELSSHENMETHGNDVERLQNSHRSSLQPFVMTPSCVSSEDIQVIG